MYVYMEILFPMYVDMHAPLRRAAILRLHSEFEH